jgi:hypothetical protein
MPPIENVAVNQPASLLDGYLVACELNEYGDFLEFAIVVCTRMIAVLGHDAHPLLNTTGDTYSTAI